MWTLILTLTFPSPSSGTSFDIIQSVPGFNQQALCQQAGDAWLKVKVKKDKDSIASALCVKVFE